jgi:hypothetical protein
MTAAHGFWSNGWIVPALFGLLMGLLGCIIGWLAGGSGSPEHGRIQLRRGGLFTGLLLIILGVFFLIDRNWYPLDLGDIIRHYWPVFLILIGVGMLFRRVRHPNADNSHWQTWRASHEKGETSL